MRSHTPKTKVQRQLPTTKQRGKWLGWSTAPKGLCVVCVDPRRDQKDKWAGKCGQLAQGQMLMEGGLRREASRRPEGLISPTKA